MRLISFSMTTKAFIENRKTVTRRIGWTKLRAGDRLMAVEKVQGIPLGGHVKRLGEIEVVSVRRERLDAIDEDDVFREGVEGVTTPEEFIARFGKAMNAKPDTTVTRIAFRKVDVPGFVPMNQLEPCGGGAQDEPCDFPECLSYGCEAEKKPEVLGG